MTAATPPWNIIEAGAVALSVAALLLIAVLWLPRLPLTRPAAVSAAVLCAASSAGTVLPLFGPHTTPATAITHLITGAAFLTFVIALGRQFHLAQQHHHTAAPGGADPEPL